MLLFALLSFPTRAAEGYYCFGENCQDSCESTYDQSTVDGSFSPVEGIIHFCLMTNLQFSIDKLTNADLDVVIKGTSKLTLTGFDTVEQKGNKFIITASGNSHKVTVDKVNDTLVLVPGQKLTVSPSEDNEATPFIVSFSNPFTLEYTGNALDDTYATEDYQKVSTITLNNSDPDSKEVTLTKYFIYKIQKDTYSNNFTVTTDLILENNTIDASMVKVPTSLTVRSPNSLFVKEVRYFEVDNGIINMKSGSGSNITFAQTNTGTFSVSLARLAYPYISVNDIQIPMTLKGVAGSNMAILDVSVLDASISYQFTAGNLTFKSSSYNYIEIVPTSEFSIIGGSSNGRFSLVLTKGTTTKLKILNSYLLPEIQISLLKGVDSDEDAILEHEIVDAFYGRPDIVLYSGINFVLKNVKTATSSGIIYEVGPFAISTYGRVTIEPSEKADLKDFWVGNIDANGTIYLKSNNYLSLLGVYSIDMLQDNEYKINNKFTVYHDGNLLRLYTMSYSHFHPNISDISKIKKPCVIDLTNGPLLLQDVTTVTEVNGYIKIGDYLQIENFNYDLQVQPKGDNLEIAGDSNVAVNFTLCPKATETTLTYSKRKAIPSITVLVENKTQILNLPANLIVNIQKGDSISTTPTNSQIEIWNHNDENNTLTIKGSDLFSRVFVYVTITGNSEMKLASGLNVFVSNPDYINASGDSLILHNTELEARSFTGTDLYQLVISGQFDDNQISLYVLNDLKIKGHESKAQKKINIYVNKDVYSVTQEDGSKFPIMTFKGKSLINLVGFTVAENTENSDETISFIEGIYLICQDSISSLFYIRAMDMTFKVLNSQCYEKFNNSIPNSEYTRVVLDKSLNLDINSITKPYNVILTHYIYLTNVTDFSGENGVLSIGTLNITNHGTLYIFLKENVTISKTFSLDLFPLRMGKTRIYTGTTSGSDTNTFYITNVTSVSSSPTVSSSSDIIEFYPNLEIYKNQNENGILPTIYITPNGTNLELYANDKCIPFVLELQNDLNLKLSYLDTIPVIFDAKTLKGSYNVTLEEINSKHKNFIKVINVDSVDEPNDMFGFYELPMKISVWNSAVNNSLNKLTFISNQLYDLITVQPVASSLSVTAGTRYIAFGITKVTNFVITLTNPNYAPYAPPINLAAGSTLSDQTYYPQKSLTIDSQQVDNIGFQVYCYESETNQECDINNIYTYFVTKVHDSDSLANLKSGEVLFIANQDINYDKIPKDVNIVFIRASNPVSINSLANHPVFFYHSEAAIKDVTHIKETNSKIELSGDGTNYQTISISAPSDQMVTIQPKADSLTIQDGKKDLPFLLKTAGALTISLDGGVSPSIILNYENIGESSTLTLQSGVTLLVTGVESVDESDDTNIVIGKLKVVGSSQGTLTVRPDGINCKLTVKGSETKDFPFNLLLPHYTDIVGYSAMHLVLTKEKCPTISLDLATITSRYSSVILNEGFKLSISNIGTVETHEDTMVFNGNFSVLNYGTIPMTCAPNYEYSSDTNTCNLRCSAGSYIDTDDTCKPCPEGTYSDDLATSCPYTKLYILTYYKSYIEDIYKDEKYYLMNENDMTQLPDTIDAKSLVVIYIHSFSTGLVLPVTKFNYQTIKISSVNDISLLEDEKLTFSQTTVLTGKSDSTTLLEGVSGAVPIMEEYNKYLVVSFEDTLTIKQEEGAAFTQPIALAPQSAEAKIVLDSSVDVTKQKFTISPDSQAKKITLSVNDQELTQEQLNAFLDTTGSSVEIVQEVESTTSQKGLSTGALVGIIIGSVGVVGILAVIGYVIKKKKDASQVTTVPA